MKYLIANLKMKLVSEKENAEYLVAFANEMKGMKQKEVQMIICPTFLFLGEFKRKLPKGMALGAQDVFWEDKGAYTGGVSPCSLFDMGVSFSIVGHSERREYFGETDEMVAKKIQACCKTGIRPIVCVGETELERNEGKTFEVIKRQVQVALSGISPEFFRRVIIAYEPRWSIGTNRTPTSREIMEVAISIRKFLVGIFERNDVDALPILYGGSVSADQAYELCVRPGLSGALVGRESLVPKELVNISRVLTESF